MTVEPFKAEHVREMLGTDKTAERYEDVSTAAYTFRVDGRPILCGGYVEVGPHKALLWSFVTPDARRYAKTVHVAATRFISMLRHTRVEATCRTGFVKGAAWLKRLGFEYEGTMRKWGPDGGDYDIYAKVRA